MRRKEREDIEKDDEEVTNSWAIVERPRCIGRNKAKKIDKASDSYIARLRPTGTKPDQPRFTIIRNGS